MARSRRHGRWAAAVAACSAALAGLLAGVLAPVSAQAAVSCGAVVTASTNVGLDLVCASGDGLVISTSGITVDLKGHTVSGGPGTSANAAIRITPGVHDVTVQNGTLTGFGDGVVADTTQAVHITKLRIDVADQGVLLANASGTLVDKNAVAGSARDGIKVDGSYNRIAQNTVTGNAFGISVSNGSTGTSSPRTS